MEMRRVVVLGGYGNFGRLIAEELRQTYEVVIGGRNEVAGTRFAESIDAKFVRCEAQDPRSLRTAIQDAWLVVNASGPYNSAEFSIPKGCIENGAHYIDLADGRDYVKHFASLDEPAKRKDVFACTAASTTPAVTAALARSLIGELGAVKTIQVYLSVGNKSEPGLATLKSILSNCGTHIDVWMENHWTHQLGWSMREHHLFAAPVGRRLVQLCNVPDLDVLPSRFAADDVIFRAGVELALFDNALSVLALCKRILPSLDLPALGPTLLALSKLFGAFGTLAGGVEVVIEDERGQRKSAAFVTAENGRRIPASPAVLLARHLAERGVPASGAFTCTNFIELEEFRSYLAPFGIQFVTR